MKTKEMNQKLLLVGALGHLLCWLGGDLLLYFVPNGPLDTMQLFYYEETARMLQGVNPLQFTISGVAGTMAMMLAFGYPKGDQLCHDLKSFKRKPVEQITDKPDPRLEPARLAPSAVNSQPWFFAHEGNTIHVWCSKKSSRLDAGIALAHLYVANEESFKFFRADHITDLPGYSYIGSVNL